MAELKISKELEKDPDFLHMKLEGNLDLFTYGELKAAFDQVDFGKVGQRLAVDLSGVPYVASSGWGVLMSRSKILKQAGGALVVHSLNEGNGKVYETLHVDSMMPRLASAAELQGFFKSRK